MPDQPPPFGPYKAASDDPKQNLLGYLEWVSEALWRNHVLAETNLKYSRAIYEALYRAGQARPVNVAGVMPRRKIPVDKIAVDLGRFVVNNREQITKFLRMIIK